MTRAFLSAAILALTLSGAPAAPSAAPRPQPPNAVQQENALPGTTEWQVQGTEQIELYASAISAAPGDSVDVHVSTPWRYRLLVYRLGWYGGAGARLVDCVPGCAADEQGAVQRRPTGGEPIRAGWPVTDVLRLGADWVSGYYLVEGVLTSGPDAGRAGTTFLVVRQPPAAFPSRILVQVPVNTWEAYNQWGGQSLYDAAHARRAHAVSFDRPFGALAQTPMWWEIQLVRFLEREGYDVSYQADTDTDAQPGSLLSHRLVIVAGHDEYWSAPMRSAFDTAVAQGTNLAFMGSNDAYWRIDYQDGGRTIYTWKSMYDPNPVPSERTAMWRELDHPECLLMAVQHTNFAVLPNQLDYTVTAAGAADPWLAGSGFRAGDSVAGVVGREHDQLNPWPPACIHPGLDVLFHYDGGGVDQPADAVRFTAPSGARVFASGAQQFSWGLDAWRSDGSLFPAPPVSASGDVPVDPRLQQFARNALDDLTRPAPATAVTATVVGGVVQVVVQSPPDQRVLRFSAGIRAADGTWTRLCRGTTTCTGPVPAGPAPWTVGVVEVDQWHRCSAVTRVVVQR